MTKTSCVGSHVCACVLVSHGMVVWLMFFIFFYKLLFWYYVLCLGLVITCLSTIGYKLRLIVTVNGTEPMWHEKIVCAYGHAYVYIVRTKYLYTNLLRGWADPLRRISYKITLTYRCINIHIPVAIFLYTQYRSKTASTKLLRWSCTQSIIRYFS